MPLYKIAVLGEKDSVIAFSALGLDVFPVENGDEAQNRFRAITKDNNTYSIIYVTETYYEALASDIDKYKDSVTPAVILIPGAGGSTGIGTSAIESAVDRAVGTNII